MSKTIAAAVFLFALALMAASVCLAQAQSPNPYETLDQYVADLQKNPNDSTLREKIIKLALEMSLPPAIPAEAEVHTAQGIILAQKAKDAEDSNNSEEDIKKATECYKNACRELEQAANIAPWIGDCYLNLAIVQEKAGLHDARVENLFFYLMTKPSPSDAQWALNQLASELQKSSNNGALRERIISISRGITPLPEIPLAAKRIVAQAAAKVNAANKAGATGSAFADAVKEYQKAIELAPWYANFYYDIAVLQGKAGQTNETIASYKLYLLAAPDAPDADRVRAAIAELSKPSTSNEQIALNQLVTELRMSPNDQALRERIFSLARKIVPSPELPEESQHYAAQSVGRAKSAVSPSDFTEAARYLEKAIEIAPWYANFYYGLAGLQASAGRNNEAIATYKLYLLAAPDGPEAQTAKAKIAEIEAAAVAALSRRQLLRFFNREWQSQNPIAVNDRDGDRRGFKLTADVSDDGSAKVTLTGIESESFEFEGNLEGDTVRVKFVGPRRQSNDEGSIVLKKAGGILRARISFTVAGNTYTYNDLLD